MKGLRRPLPALFVTVAPALVLAASVASCVVAGVHGGGELESRFATVHNALAAIGMSEVGALHEARLAAGQEALVALDLPQGCTTIVTVAAASVVDLEAALTDASGTRVARTAAHTSEATIRACVDAAATYTLRLKGGQGAGPLLVSTWSGASPVDVAAGGGHPGESGRTLGTCDMPLPLSAGDFAGTTTRGEHQNDSKCQSDTKSAPEIVYKLELENREKVSILVEAPHFDSVLYVRKEDCSDIETEVACNDDASPTPGGSPDQHHSRIEQIFEPGTYYVFVDGYSSGNGPFKLHVELTDVPPLAELCSKSGALAIGTPTNGTTEGAFDNGSATCGDGAHGPDTVYSLAIDRRERVRIIEHSDDFAPVVHLRSRCEDAQSSIGCSDSGGSDHEATFVGLLDPGSYSVFADAAQRDADGKFTLTAETSAELGSGAHGEKCADAIPLTKSEHTVTGDTFTAKDDVAGRCGGAGAPDVVYRLEVGARTRFTAHVTREEGAHVLVLMRGCDGGKSELDCGKSIDHILAPGSYFLAVDGESPASFGMFAFDWATHDTHSQDVACRAPAPLREGETLTGTTLGGAVDKFSPSCAASDNTGGAPDVVYQLVVAARKRVKLHLHTAGWGAVLSVRRSCLDGTRTAAGANEVECRADDSADVDFDSVLNAGTYFVVVDGKEPSNAGGFSLQYLAAH